MIIRGALPAIEALLDLHSPSTFASLIKAGTKIETSLRKGNFANIVSQKAAGETSQNSMTQKHRRQDAGRGAVAVVSPSPAQEQPHQQVIYRPWSMPDSAITYTTTPNYSIAPSYPH
jgi:hypothetical protein